MTVALAEIHCNRIFEYRKKSTDQHRFTYFFSTWLLSMIFFVKSSRSPRHRTALSVFSRSNGLRLSAWLCACCSAFIDGAPLYSLRMLFSHWLYIQTNLIWISISTEMIKTKAHTSSWNSTAYQLKIDWNSNENTYKAMIKWLGDMLLINLIHFIGTQLKSRKNSDFSSFV